MLEQVGDHGQLVRHLGAAEHDHVRPRGVFGQPLEHLDLGLDQAAGRVGQQRGDVVDAGLLAVHDTEAVGDEDVAQGRVLVGQLAALGLVLGLLARLVADVLQHRDLAVGEPGDDLWAEGPTTSSASVTSAPSSSPSRLAAGASEYFGLTWPLGRPRWASTTTLAPASRSWFRVGSDARIRPSSVIVLAVQRHVQVAADQHPLARRSPRSETDFTGHPFRWSAVPKTGADAELPDSAGARRNGGTSTGPAQRAEVRATCRPGRRGRRGGWSSPTRCRTSRRP